MNLGLVQVLTDSNCLTFVAIKLINVRIILRKEFRNGRTDIDPIFVIKSVILLHLLEAFNWAYRIARISNTRPPCAMHGVAHEEVYPKEKLCRYPLKLG